MPSTRKPSLVNSLVWSGQQGSGKVRQASQYNARGSLGCVFAAGAGACFLLHPPSAYRAAMPYLTLPYLSSLLDTVAISIQKGNALVMIAASIEARRIRSGV